MSANAQELWSELLEVGPTNEDLRYIIRFVETLRQQAWELLKPKATNEDIRYIIRFVEPLRQQATKLLKRSREEIMEDIKKL